MEFIKINKFLMLLIIISSIKNNTQHRRHTSSKKLVTLAKKLKISPNIFTDRIPYWKNIKSTKKINSPLSAKNKKQRIKILSKNEVNYISFKYNLAIATQFKNEAEYLDEWIRWHLKMGVEHFYLYNDNSSDNFLEILQPYIEQGIVELNIAIVNPNLNYKIGSQYNNENIMLSINDSKLTKERQDCFLKIRSSYTDAVNKSRYVSKWLALIDIDEYILPLQDDLLHLLNSQPPNTGGVSLNWECYGTSNIEKCPSGKMTTTLIFKAPHNEVINTYQTKCIVKPNAISKCNVHSHEYLSGFKSFNINPNICRINHYLTKDLDYFSKKIAWYQTHNIMNLSKWYFRGEKDISISDFLTLLNSVYDPIMLTKW